MKIIFTADLHLPAGEWVLRLIVDTAEDEEVRNKATELIYNAPKTEKKSLRRRNESTSYSPTLCLAYRPRAQEEGVPAVADTLPGPFPRSRDQGR